MKDKESASPAFQKRALLVKSLFWLFTLALVLLNIIPLGNADSSLSRNRILRFRLDHIVHATILFGFAWIYLLAKCLNTRIFASREKLKITTLIILLALILEPLQLFVPWRSFNPFDLYANIIGAIIAAIVVWLS